MPVEVAIEWRIKRVCRWVRTKTCRELNQQQLWSLQTKMVLVSLAKGHGKVETIFQIYPPFLYLILPVVHHETTPISHLQNLRELPTASTLKRLKTNKQNNRGRRIDDHSRNQKNFFGRPFPSATKKGRVTKRENQKPNFFRICVIFDICSPAAMGIKRLAIRLDPVGGNPTSSSRVYSPGDIVSGYVAIYGNGIVNINGINKLMIPIDSRNVRLTCICSQITGLYLEVEGRAKVAWNKNDNTYRAQNSYMQLTIPLIHDSLYLQGKIACLFVCFSLHNLFMWCHFEYLRNGWQWTEIPIQIYTSAWDSQFVRR